MIFGYTVFLFFFNLPHFILKASRKYVITAKVRFLDSAAFDQNCVYERTGHDLKEFIINNRKKLILGISACAAAILLAAFIIWFNFVPYMLVSLDVNPSIEYSVSHANRVLSATAVNDDGSEILDGLDLKNKPISDAVQETVQKISDAGYFDGDDPGAIEITASETSGSATDKADALAKDLQSDAQQVTEDQGKTVDVEAESVTPDFVQQAKALGISPGKLNLIQKLQASSADPSSVTVQDWANKPVKDIMKTIKENKKAEKANGNNKDDGTTASTTDSSSLDPTNTGIIDSDNSNTDTNKADSDKSEPNDAENGSDEQGPNENATKNTPNSHANSNATKNWKYSDTTKAPDADDYDSPTDSQSAAAAVTESKTTRTQTTHVQTTHAKSDNGKGNK